MISVDLSGHVAIVTGAGGALGAAEARLLRDAGAQVVCTDVTALALGDITDDPAGMTVMKHDITRAEDWQRVFAETERIVGPPTILVNNAGVFEPEPLMRTELSEWRRHIDVIQTGTFLGLQSAAHQTSVNAIVNIASTVALRGTAGMFAYQAAKSAVRGMTRSAARDLAPRVRVNAVLPGLTQSAMAERNTAEFNERIAASIPLQRIGQPDDIASAVVFLASPLAQFITGAELVVDGGMHA